MIGSGRNPIASTSAETMDLIRAPSLTWRPLAITVALVVGCTGNALAGDQKSFLQAGVTHVLCKPIKQADLKSMLAVAIQRRTPVEIETILSTPPGEIHTPEL